MSEPAKEPTPPHREWTPAEWIVVLGVIFSGLLSLINAYRGNVVRQEINRQEGVERAVDNKAVMAAETLEKLQNEINRANAQRSQ